MEGFGDWLRKKGYHYNESQEKNDVIINININRRRKTIQGKK